MDHCGLPRFPPHVVFLVVMIMNDTRYLTPRTSHPALTIKVLGSECVTCDTPRDTPRDSLRDTGPFLDTDHGAET